MSDREPLSQHPHGIQIEELEGMADSRREDLSKLIDNLNLAEMQVERYQEKVEKVRQELQDLLKIIKALEA